MENENVKEKSYGYIVINEKLRIRVTVDCLILEEKTGEKDGEVTYGNFKYITSWGNMLDYLVKRFTAEKISKKKICTFEEARIEIKAVIKELKLVLLGEIDKELRNGKSEIKGLINKFNL